MDHINNRISPDAPPVHMPEEITGDAVAFTYFDIATAGGSVHGVPDGDYLHTGVPSVGNLLAGVPVGGNSPAGTPPHERSTDAVPGIVATWGGRR